MSLKHTKSADRSNRSMRGAAMIEFVLVLIPLLLLGLAGIELMRLNQIKQTVLFALHEASRQAIIHHADPHVIKMSFEAALSPLRRETTQLRQYTQNEPDSWRIEILEPTFKDFADFAHKGLTNLNGRPTIRNNFLTELHQEKLAAGWKRGKGPKSGHDVYEANTLKLRISYFYKPILPGLGKIIKILVRSKDAEINAAHRRGLLVIRGEQQSMMQSHPILWPAK